LIQSWLYILSFYLKEKYIILIWIKKLKSEKKKGAGNSQNTVIAVGKLLCSAGIAGAGFPCARNACMKIIGA